MNDPITWKRLKAIFDNPKPVEHVWQHQFDYDDGKLKELALTKLEEIDFGDMWYYHHDLAYMELQPELFKYLFPVCLMDWHQSLLANDSCSHGDSEFHYGIIHGNVLDKMLTPTRRNAVNQVFVDSMLFRLHQERFLQWDHRRSTAYGWILRLNSLGLFFDQLPDIWRQWWKVESVGHALCIMEYCSALMYFYFDNPVIPQVEGWTRGGPYLGGSDSHVHDRGWSEPNIEFLRGFLTINRVKEAVTKAKDVLRDQPEGPLAGKMCGDLEESNDLIASRIDELPSILASGDCMKDWTV